jgi:Tfp pilus assembly PilM family ATPase
VKGARTTLPLGIDFGRNRVRVALAVRDEVGRCKLEAVAAREVTSDAANALRDALDELNTKERRCIIGIGSPDALLRTITLPPMSRLERRRAATFQAARFIDYPVGDAVVSLGALESNQRWLLGIARRSAIDARVDAAKRARLRPVAIDDIAFSSMRVHRDADGTIDITAGTTRLTIFARPVPFVADIPVGAMDLTEGIARALGIDGATAEERKRSVGFAGAGEAQRDALIDHIAATLGHARAAGHSDIRRLALIGNGSRIPGLPEAIERATGYGVRMGTLDGSSSDTLPADVLRAAGPDWSVAYGLTLWEVAV